MILKLAVLLRNVPHWAVIFAPTVLVLGMQLLKDLPGTSLASIVPYVQAIVMVAGYIANNAKQLAPNSGAAVTVDAAIISKGTP
jgi:hypothetical protein